MTHIIVTVDRLCKTFGPVKAVNDLSFQVERGKTVALLGGNGAGKTTAMSMMMGLLLPTSGRIDIFGEDVVRHRYRVLPRMNFSSPYVDLPHRLTVRENLLVYARLYGVARPRDRVDELAREFDLKDLLNRPTGRLSSGQKTRVSLAKSLLNRPELLLLDEPTASLDPDTADLARGYLEAYRDRTGAAILLASHNMSEVERMADHVLIMRTGRLEAEGAPRALLERFGRATMEEVFLDVARNRPRRERAAP